MAYKTSARNHCQWWTITDNDELARVIWDHLQAQQVWRRTRLDEITELQQTYEREADAFDTETWSSFCDRFDLGDIQPPCLNITKAGVDTVASRLLESLPAVQAAPYNLPPEVETQAREMTDALNGSLNTDEAHDEVNKALLSFLNEGMTFMMPVIADNRVEYMELEYYECFWDPQDARKGKPRSFHVWLRVSKSELLAQWKRYKGRELPDVVDIPGGIEEVLTAIEEMPEAHPRDLDGDSTGGSIYEWRMRQRTADLYSITADQVHVVHSWHLPGGPGADDGLHVITLHPGSGQGGGKPAQCKPVVMMREKWELPRLPVVWASPYPHNEGIDGNGIGHLLRGQQAEVDRLAHRVTQTSKEIGRAHVVIDESWEIEKERIADQGATNFIKLKTGGMMAAPVLWKPEPVSAQDLGLIDRYLGPWSLGLAGISTALAQAGSRLGPQVSGIALVEENRKQDDRMSPVERQVRRFVRQLAEVTLDVIERAVELDPDFELVWQDEHSAPRRMKWSEARLPRESFSIRLEEVNPFGSTYAARLQKLIEMGDRYPELSQTIVPEILGAADLRKVQRYETADDRLVDDIIKQLLDVRGPEPSPDIHTPLELAQVRLLQVWRDLAARRASYKMLRRLENYLAKVIAKAQQTAAQAAPAEPPMMGAPAPAAPPMGPDPGAEMAVAPPGGPVIA